MSRLIEKWVETIERELPDYEKSLRCKTGLNFTGIAASANNLPYQAILDKTDTHSVAVVPISSGKGLIGSFSSAVASIIRQAGFHAFVTNCTDVDGMYEAYSQDAKLIFMADDRRYAGFALETRRISDNNEATARGFVHALDAMCPDGVSDKKVLVMGCGIIGKLSADILLKKNAFPVFYDKPSIAEEISGCISDPREISNYQYIIDATNEGEWLKNDMLHNEVFISAPGVPLSLDHNALIKHEERLIHDVLHIGTLTMLGELLSYSKCLREVINDNPFVVSNRTINNS